MAKTTRQHRVTQFAIVDGFTPPEGSGIPPGRRHDNLNFSLSEGRARIQSSRRTADAFHAYAFDNRDGIPLHIAYARHLPHSPQRPYGPNAAHFDITYVYEVTDEAVTASFGLHTT